MVDGSYRNQVTVVADERCRAGRTGSMEFCSFDGMVRWLVDCAITYQWSIYEDRRNPSHGLAHT